MKNDMKEVSWEIEQNDNIFAVTIRITDRAVAFETLMPLYTGCTLDDALYSANKRLKMFGYYVK